MLNIWTHVKNKIQINCTSDFEKLLQKLNPILVFSLEFEIPNVLHSEDLRLWLYECNVSKKVNDLGKS